MKDLERNVNQESDSIYDTLVTYSESDFYPYHMPGHKRRLNPAGLSDFFKLDITEIDGFDNLHQAEGIIRRAQERAADLYGADETFLLVNGSTCGVLAAILSVTDKSDTVLIARNCHKSVYHAAFLQELNLRYVYPEQIEEYDINGAINPADVANALVQYPECRAVIITSPTYEGIVSDIASIAQIVHDKGIPLIVDEAHGAHFGLTDDVPAGSVRQGADFVIHSLHKTLPSMTQTALLHVNGSYVNRTRLRRYLSIFQSSSPSYVLMAGMDACISYVRNNASDCFRQLRVHYNNFIKKMKKCHYIHIAEPELLTRGKYYFAAWDICKLVISVKGASISGQRLYDILREEYHLQMEMAAASYVLAIMTIADGEEAWKRLADALWQIDGSIEEADIIKEADMIKDAAMINKCTEPFPESYPESYNKPDVRLNIAQALALNQEEVLLSQSQGKISADFVNLYPPGIPILVPGEVIDGYIIEQIQYNLDLGLNVQGISPTGTIRVITA